jgi:hypothetical protein
MSRRNGLGLILCGDSSIYSNTMYFAGGIASVIRLRMMTCGAILGAIAHWELSSALMSLATSDRSISKCCPDAASI